MQPLSLSFQPYHTQLAMMSPVVFAGKVGYGVRMSTSPLKTNLREQIMAKRAALSEAECRNAMRAIAEHAISTVPFEQQDVIAGYWASNRNAEIDMRLLLEMLEENGHALCLPVAKQADAPLIFRRYHRGDRLVHHAKFPIEEPAGTRPEITPNVLLCPLLAVDKRGYRLGYGGGYYDRTIKQLRSLDDVNKRLLTVGIGYGFQLVDTIPAKPHDEPLDLLITEDGITIFAER